jgi:hypothetical protein
MVQTATQLRKYGTGFNRVGWGCCLLVITCLAATAAGQPVMEIRIDGDLVDNNGEFDFGGVLVGDSRAVTLQIRNTGDAFLNVTNLAFSGDNAADFFINLLALSLAPNATFNATLTFSPTDEGLRSATLTITNNASPYAVNLRGMGSTDSNENGIPDDEDIANGTSEDCNTNGIPDECEDDLVIFVDCLAVTLPDGMCGLGLCGSGAGLTAPLMLFGLGCMRRRRRG